MGLNTFKWDGKDEKVDVKAGIYLINLLVNNKIVRIPKKLSKDITIDTIAPFQQIFSQ
ncbi:MAG: hypothetical protein R2764_21870 [Bacteroidales bacterium]